jgi:glycine/D-amino acid oxidase-like deaminating enzyme
METAPESILIVGSGLFGLSTAWSLTKRPFFDRTAITVVDDANGQFPPEDAASVDSSRIVRADYADQGQTATLRRVSTVGGIPTKELFQLFPKKPAKKMAYIAGLPKPVGCV